MAKRGLFVAIEGGDGLGKTTLINNLKKYYADAVFTHEPGGNEFCEKVRNLIMESDGLTKQTEMYLFCASRAEFVDKIVLPNITSGKIVITDRYVYSSLVYQGVLGGLGIVDVLNANKMALNSTLPDIVICLKGNKSFRTKIENRYDKQTEKQSKIIYDGFDGLGKMFNNFKYIDVADKTENQVFEIAKDFIDKELKLIND